MVSVGEIHKQSCCARTGNLLSGSCKRRLSVLGGLNFPSSLAAKTHPRGPERAGVRDGCTEAQFLGVVNSACEVDILASSLALLLPLLLGEHRGAQKRCLLPQRMGDFCLAMEGGQSPVSLGGRESLPPGFSSTPGNLDPEVWAAIAGPLLCLPRVGSLVVYFPQGYAEQQLDSMELAQELASRTQHPAQVLCRLEQLTLQADEVTEDLSLSYRLQPVRDNDPALHQAWNQASADSATEDDWPFRASTNENAVWKILSRSDIYGQGGLAVPKKAAERCLPPLDRCLDPPAEDVAATDLFGRTWVFKHVLRGKPLRHLLTTNWNRFVAQKKLQAPDRVVLIRGQGDKLKLGIRRAALDEGGSAASVRQAAQAAASLADAELALNEAQQHAIQGTPFQVVYNVQAGGAVCSFVVPLDQVCHALKQQATIGPGKGFKMAFETNEVNVRRFKGSVVASTPLTVQPSEMHFSSLGPLWRSIQVAWADSDPGVKKPSRVSPWDIALLPADAGLGPHPQPLSEAAKGSMPLHEIPAAVFRGLPQGLGGGKEEREAALRLGREPTHDQGAPLGWQSGDRERKSETAAGTGPPAPSWMLLSQHESGDVTALDRDGGRVPPGPEQQEGPPSALHWLLNQSPTQQQSTESQPPLVMGQWASREYVGTPEGHPRSRETRSQDEAPGGMRQSGAAADWLGRSHSSECERALHHEADMFVSSGGAVPHSRPPLEGDLCQEAGRLQLGSPGNLANPSAPCGRQLTAAELSTRQEPVGVVMRDLAPWAEGCVMPQGLTSHARQGRSTSATVPGQVQHPPAELGFMGQARASVKREMDAEAVGDAGLHAYGQGQAYLERVLGTTSRPRGSSAEADRGLQGDGLINLNETLVAPPPQALKVECGSSWHGAHKVPELMAPRAPEQGRQEQGIWGPAGANAFFRSRSQGTMPRAAYSEDPDRVPAAQGQVQVSSWPSAGDSIFTRGAHSGFLSSPSLRGGEAEIMAAGGQAGAMEQTQPYMAVENTRSPASVPCQVATSSGSLPSSETHLVSAHVDKRQKVVPWYSTDSTSLDTSATEALVFADATVHRAQNMEAMESSVVVPGTGEELCLLTLGSATSGQERPEGGASQRPGAQSQQGGNEPEMPVTRWLMD